MIFTYPIGFQSFGTVLLFLTETISALAFIKDVRCELPAIRSPRHDCQRSGSVEETVHYVTVHSMAHTRNCKTLPDRQLLHVIRYFVPNTEFITNAPTGECAISEITASEVNANVI